MNERLLKDQRERPADNIPNFERGLYSGIKYIKFKTTSALY